MVVSFEVDIKVFLHLCYTLIPLRPPLEAEMFIQQGAVQPFDKAVAQSQGQNPGLLGRLAVVLLFTNSP